MPNVDNLTAQQKARILAKAHAILLTQPFGNSPLGLEVQRAASTVWSIKSAFEQEAKEGK